MNPIGFFHIDSTERRTEQATVNRYCNQTDQELQKHLDAFIAACNVAKRLETIRRLTPCGFIV